MAEKLKADRVLDVKGTLCPMPIIEVKRATDEAASGQIIKVLATDPGSQRDMEAWTRCTGNGLLQATEENGVFVFFVQKA